MRNLRLCSEWPQTHPDFYIKQFRYKVTEGYEFDIFWNDVRKKFSEKPLNSAIMGIKTKVDLSFMEDVDWSFVDFCNTTVPHASAYAFVFAYERYLDEKNNISNDPEQ